MAPWKSRRTTNGLVAVVCLTAIGMPLGRASATGGPAAQSQAASFKGGGQFGLSIALAGSTLFAGGDGKVDVFAERNTVWKSDGTLQGSGGPQSGFGAAVSASGPVLVVGAAGQRGGGRVYVFNDGSGGWRQTRELVPSRGETRFGAAVAVSGSTAVVSAVAPSQTGRLIVFRKDGVANWSRMAELGIPGAPQGFEFGVALAVSGPNIIVGAGSLHGYATYFFEKKGRVWRKAGSFDFPGIISAESAVAISDQYALLGVGSYGQEFGRVFVFSKTGDTWRPTGQLSEPYSLGLEEFGTSVAISGSRAVIGAACYRECAGVAYEFTRTRKGWSQVRDLTGSNLVAGDYFGVSAAMSGDTAAVGAFPGREVYLFKL